MSRSAENALSQQEKFTAVCHAIRTDAEACDLKTSLFCLASVRSYHLGSDLKPIPPTFATPGDVDIESVVAVLKKIPTLQEVLEKTDNRPEKEVVDFLHWLLVELPDPQVTRIDPIDARHVLEQFNWEKRELRPNYIFRLDFSPDSIAERRFQEFASEFPTKYAFHGSRTHNFHSILNFGLAQHLNKRSAFGEGIYLSSDLSVSISYSPSEATWTHSRLGKSISCVALCEYAEHPTHVKCHEAKNSKIPKNIMVVSNNEIIRVRYLLVYGRKPRKTAQNAERSVMTWLMNHKATVLIISYAFLLLAVNLTTSSNSLWSSVLNMAKRFLPSCFQ
ncbi:protein mono-ADP-ribosyltransferase PARP16-like [Phlebotomus argentipes]|uniref:protein mono-ADP-ribosyltransferase PARP16-like n=1 Tax=Phlebotomus argentipes TaxID=94469 RepID=UPI002893091C|nr:protein mono-ADP-ribosyltransferase PARP16-like [Phlebotomus argentipes]